MQFKLLLFQNQANISDVHLFFNLIATGNNAIIIPKICVIGKDLAKSLKK